MGRAEILSFLESFWNKVHEDYPDIAMDIPSAMEYYNTLTYEQLLTEFNRKIGEV